ncbi:MAG: FecR family protein [Pseudolabrys sp.]
MFVKLKAVAAVCLLAMAAILFTASGAAAQDNVWRIGKSSGEVWVTHQGAAPAPVTGETLVKPGDKIRTGQNGRVLLLRGEESMLISPNAVIGISAQNSGSMTTTIIQQAGSILLEVEKRNVKHFSVETPHLAAVVKGTQFRVSVGGSDSKVEVVRGLVEVSAFKSGQRTVVLPGQVADVSAQGPSNLAVSGAGTFNPIELTTPSVSPVQSLSSSDAGAPVAAGAAKKVQPNKQAALQGEGGSVQLPIADAAPVRSASRMSSVSDNSWSSWVMDLTRKVGGSRNEDLAMTLSFPIGIGILVAGMVGVQRRWQKRKAQ